MRRALIAVGGLVSITTACSLNPIVRHDAGSDRPDTGASDASSDAVDVQLPMDVADASDSGPPLDAQDVQDSGPPIDVIEDTGPFVPAPRPIAPLSTSIVTGVSVKLRWTLAATPWTGALIDICENRLCTGTVTTIRATLPNSAILPASATNRRGVYFWRLRGTAGAETEGRTNSPVWQFTITHVVTGSAPTPIPSSWGSIPDFNGDGFSDMAVGEPLDRGVVVYYGSPTGPMGAPTVLPRAGVSLGETMASIGDVNGDGFGDLGVSGTVAAGRAYYVYLGGPAGLALTPALTLPAPGGVTGYGKTGFVGDIDSDGYADLLVGATGVAGVSPGLVYVHLGSATGITFVPSQTLVGASNGDSFGAAIVGLGGERSAGTNAYVAISSPDTNGGQGIVSIYAAVTGSTNLVSLRDFAPNPTSASNAGRSLGIADVNGDGYVDLAVGEPADRGTPRSGKMRVFVGMSSDPGINTADPGPTGPSPAIDRFGSAVSGVPDLDGDGYDEIAAGAPGGSIAWLIDPSRGNRSTPLSPSGAPCTFFGGAVAGIGRTNSTTSTIVVGAPSDSCPGSVYSFEGPVPGAAAPLSGTSTAARFGTSIAGGLGSSAF